MMMFNKLLAPDRHINNRWHPPQTTLTTSLVYFCIHYELYSCFKKISQFCKIRETINGAFLVRIIQELSHLVRGLNTVTARVLTSLGIILGSIHNRTVWSQSYCVVTFGQARQKRDKTGIAGWVVCWDGGALRIKPAEETHSLIPIPSWPGRRGKGISCWRG